MKISSEMKNILIVGASGHAKVVIDIIEKEEKYKIIGLLDQERKVGSDVFGYPILGNSDEIAKICLENKVNKGLIAIGDNWIRKEVSKKLKRLDPHFEFISTCHPSAQIARGVSIGQGVVIMAGVSINSDAVVGDHCILNTNSSLDHDGAMAHFSSLAPGATIGGNVKIGIGSAIMIGASVAHNIEIKDHVVVGAGSVVLSSIPSHSVVYGVPGTVIREREAGAKYL